MGHKNRVENLRQDKTRQQQDNNKTRQDKTRQDKTRQDNALRHLVKISHGAIDWLKIKK